MIANSILLDDLHSSCCSRVLVQYCLILSSSCFSGAFLSFSIAVARFLSSLLSHPRTVEIILRGHQSCVSRFVAGTYCWSKFMPLSDFVPPNHWVTVLMFIFASSNRTMPFSIVATLPTFKVWRITNHGSRSLARLRSGSRDCPRGETTRV